MLNYKIQEAHKAFGIVWLEVVLVSHQRVNYLVALLLQVGKKSEAPTSGLPSGGVIHSRFSRPKIRGF